MASFNISELPNPFTPKAFFPPTIAYQFQIAEYIYAGTLGALVWDTLSNLHNDYKLISGGYKIGLGTVAYFFCRFWTFLYILAGTLYQTYPLQRCATVSHIALSFYAIALPANSLLFFLRVRAIYDRNNFLVAVFFCLWLSVIGGAITVPAGVGGGNIGPTDYCITTSSTNSVGASAVTPLIHDTVVFIAISLRLFKNAHINHGVTASLKAFFTGEYLPQFSRAVLQDGQLYYLITVTSNLLTVIMFYNTRVDEEYRTMFSVCNLMLTNVMACHVFRNTKFGFHKRVPTTSELLSQQSGTVLFMKKPPAQSSTARTEVTLGSAPGSNYGKDYGVYVNKTQEIAYA